MLRAMLRDFGAYRGRVGMPLVAIVLGVVSDSAAVACAGRGGRVGRELSALTADGVLVRAKSLGRVGF